MWEGDFMKNKCLTRLISALLTICMICQPVLPSIAHTYTEKLLDSSAPVRQVDDYSNHWAAEYIDYLLDRGFIIGYENGEIRPENLITRAELVTAINKTFNFTAESDDNFADITGTEWFANQFKKAKHRGYINGDENGNANPEALTSRAEIVVMIANMLEIEPIAALTSFLDAGQVPDWAMSSLIAMEEREYILGYPDNTFRPLNILTRAEAFAILARIRWIVLETPELLEKFDISDDETPAGEAVIPASTAGPATIPKPAPTTRPSNPSGPSSPSTPKPTPTPAPTPTPTPAPTQPTPSPSPKPTLPTEPDDKPDPTPEPEPTPTPAPPHLAVAVTGELRVNRKLTVSGASSTGNIAEYEELIRDGQLILEIRPVDPSVPPGAAIRIDSTTVRDDFMELVIKQPGEYEITFHYDGPRGTASTTQFITISPDLPPVPDFSVNKVYYRDDGITILDNSKTERGDIIEQREWTIIHDKNANNDFSDDIPEKFVSTYKELQEYITKEVGLYQVSLTVTETFENRIDAFLDASDFLSATTAVPKVFEVKNRAPSVTGSVGKAKQLDIAVVFGSIVPSREQSFGNALEEVAKKLEERGVSVALSGISDIDNAYDTWTFYEHPDYNGGYNNSRVPWPRAHSVFWEGDDIWMDGFTSQAYKDFLFKANDDPGEKTLNFELRRDRTDWHSMEGGGFLFNTVIDEQENTIEGYAILVTTNGLRLFRINRNNLTYFRNGAHPTSGSGTGNGMAAYGQLLTTVNIGNATQLYDMHTFKMVVTPTTVSVWHNGQEVITNYKLPVEALGYGFGPITAHGSHGCAQVSYFTFSNLRMGVDESETLANVLTKHEWTPGANRSLVHISDGTVESLADKTTTGKIAASVLRQDIDYFAVSIEDSADQFTDILRVLSDNGNDLNGADYDVFVAQMTELLWQKVSTDRTPGLLTPDDRLEHTVVYFDTEGDPMDKAQFLYSHDIGAFPVNTGLIAGNGEFDDRREVLGKVGDYDVYVRVNDKPGDIEALAAANSRWSETTHLGRVTVHQLPKALLNGSLSLGPDGSGSAVLKMTESSYDPDHAERPDRGVAATEWRWKRLSDAAWTAGKPPAMLPYEEEYLVCYRVLDIDGAWSVPACLHLNTVGMTPVIVGPDTEAPVINLTTYNVNDWGNPIETIVFNVGDQVWLEAGAIDNVSVSAFELYLEGRLISQIYGRNLFGFSTPGIKTVEAIARDPSGNESRETLILTVLGSQGGVDTVPPVIVLHQPVAGEPISGVTSIVATISDDVKVASWKLEYKGAAEADYTLMNQGTEAVNRLAIGSINPADMADGTYEYRISATDSFGNTAPQVVFIITVSRSTSGDRQPPVTQIQSPVHGDIVNGIVAVHGTAKDETTLAASRMVLIAPDGSETVLAEVTAGAPGTNGTIGANGREATFAANWDTTAGLDGVYRLELTAADQAGNSHTNAITVYVNNRDNHAPRLEFITPKHADTISGSVPIKVSITDDTGIASYELAIQSAADENFVPVKTGSGTVGGTAAGTGSGSEIYLWNTLGVPDGICALRLTAENPDGGYAWRVIYVIVANGSGSGGGQGGAGQAELVVNNGQPTAAVSVSVPIRVLADEPFLLSSLIIKVNGSVIPCDANGFASFVPTAVGIYEITATIADKSGGQAVMSAEIRVIDPKDFQTPEVVIRTPVNGAQLGAPTNIIGSVTGDGLARYVLSFAQENSNDYYLLAEGIKPVTNGVLGEFDTTFLPDGKYKIRLTGYGANGSTFQEIQVSVQNRNDPPYLKFLVPEHNDVVQGTVPIQAFITDARGITAYELAIKAADAAAGTDFVVAASGSAAVEGGLIYNWDTAALLPGVYALRLTARNAVGGGSMLTIYVTVSKSIPSDTLELIVNNGIDYTALRTTVPIQVNYGSAYTASSLQIKVDGTALQVSTGTENGGTGKANFTPDRLGVYTVVASMTTATGDRVDRQTQIRVIDAGDNRVPEVKITSPAEGAVVTAPTDITGLVSADGLVRYTLQYAPAGSGDYVLLAEDIKAVNGKIAVFDPTLLENGFYDIVLTGYGSRSGVRQQITVSVEGEMKIGNFSIEFTDMSVPMQGFPLDVVRGYDSRRKNQSGDFGNGWQLTLSGAKLSESCAPGEYWDYASRPGGPMGLITTYYWIEEKPHEVSVDWGNGKTDHFVMKLNPAEQTLYPFSYGISVSYTAKSGTTSKLEPAGSSRDLIYVGDLLCNEWLMPYQSGAYKLTQEDGTVYIISADKGVESITDTKGNVFTINRNGISHSDGKSIVFERDGKNRITKITGPTGKTVVYRYDGAGDLTEVTDITAETTKFVYDKNHFLIDIMDPRGVRVSRNEYDDEGRLTAVIDAAGNRLTFDNDLAGRRKVITDRLGNPTLFVYDERGKVLSKTDALGHMVRSEYDTNGNLSKQIDALGKETKFVYTADGKLLSKTDPLGNVSETAYNSKGQLATVKSMGELLLTLSYDSYGNVQEAVGAGGDKLNYSYDAGGYLKGISDEIGAYTLYSYDKDGNVASITDGNGAVSTFDYDKDGNMQSRTRTRTGAGGLVSETEHYTYNTGGQITGIIRPDGTTSHLSYNAIGKIESATDANGNRKSYEYDMFGNLVTITYGDNTTETFVYDAEGQTTETTDRLGRKVKLTYDAVGNLLSKQYPNGGVVQYEYDAAGRIKRETAINGGVKEYEYDDAGRNTAVIDAMNNKTQYGYDAMARLISMTDPKSNTFEYQYDANGNRIKTLMPDGTSVSTGYDARGRVTAKTDQNGIKTEFRYDGADRLTSVSDAAGGEWLYSYDEVGNLTGVTDANGNKTQYQYDDRGHVIKTINALGDAAVSRYDEKTGALLEHTDYEGAVTKYTYDQQNRVTRKTAGTWAVDYTYTVDGKMKTAIDDRGTTRYEYDSMNGLVGVILPEGEQIAYRYDLSGNRTEISFPGYKAEYGYDKLNRLQSVVDTNGRTEYTYDANGNVASMRYPNGNRAEYSYDKNNRLSVERIFNGAGGEIASYSYTYGAAGECLRIVEKDREIVYTYDRLYRLTGETVTVNGTAQSVIEYQYDAVSNRTQKTGNSTIVNYRYNKLNQLVEETVISPAAAEGPETLAEAPAAALTEELEIQTTTTTELAALTEELPVGLTTANTAYAMAAEEIEGEITWVYRYNKNGSLVAKQTTGQSVTYGYNDRNLLESVTKTDGDDSTVESYRYDHAGNRVEKRTNGVVTRYVADTNGSLAMVIAEISADGTVFYTYGLDLICMAAADGSLIRYYHYDGHGDVRALTDQTGTVTDTYEFDGYGNLTGRTGVTNNPYLYTGERYDAFSGLYYLRARYMNPSTGTFLTMDTYQGNLKAPASLHKYLYAHANPIAYNDPTGNFVGLAMASVSFSSMVSIQTTYFSGMFKALQSVANNALRTAVGLDPGLPVPLRIMNSTIADTGTALIKGVIGFIVDVVDMGEFATETIKYVSGFLLGIPTDIWSGIGAGVDMIDWLDKITGNTIDKALQRVLGVSGFVGSVSSIIGTFGEYQKAMVQMKALATVYGAGSIGSLFLRTFHATAQGDKGAAAEMVYYIRSGLFDDIQPMVSDLIAAYMVAIAPQE